MSASAIIADVTSLLKGWPVYLTGSLVAEETYGKSNAHTDVDLFCPSDNVLIAVIQKLLDNGYTMDDRFARVWQRWLRYGFKKWHTNSMKLTSPAGVETNLVYKLVDGHPTTDLTQVLKSFDFGLLATGYDLELGVKEDYRSVWFPGLDPAGPLPMMPLKRLNWRQGFISQYNGLREAGRYAKYHAYGYDMSLVKDDLVTGYWQVSTYHASRFGDDSKFLAQIYEVIARHIEADNIDHLAETYKELDFNDSLDAIMEALE